MAQARITFVADCTLNLPDWLEGETDEQKLENWIASATEEPLEALQCVDAKWTIVGYLTNAKP